MYIRTYIYSTYNISLVPRPLALALSLERPGNEANTIYTRGMSNMQLKAGRMARGRELVVRTYVPST